MEELVTYTIYKLSIIGTDYIYVGSTKRPYKRIEDHINRCKYCHNSKLYKTINENGGPEKLKFETIIQINTNSHHQVTEIERFYINKYNANLNTSATNLEVNFVEGEDKKVRQNKRVKLWKIMNREKYNKSQLLLMNKKNAFLKEKKRMMNILL
jgi:hypothetical protein